MTKNKTKHHWQLVLHLMPLIRLGLHETIELQSMDQDDHIWIADDRIYSVDRITGLEDYWILSNLIDFYAYEGTKLVFSTTP